MKKSIKKVVVTALAVVLAVILCACTASEKETQDKKDDKKEEEVKEEKGDAGPSIKEELLFEKDGVKVTVKGIEYNGTPADSAEVTYLVENEGTENLIITNEAESVNQYDLGHVSSGGETVPVGKKMNISVHIGAEQLDELGYRINEIGEVGIKLAAWKENNEKLWDTGLLCTKTSEYGKTGEGTLEAGTEIYNMADVRIEYLGMVEEKDGYSAAELLIENTSDKDVICWIGSDIDSMVGDVQSYEEFEAAMSGQPMASCTPNVLAGKKKVEKMTFSYSGTGEKADIEALEEIKLSVKLTENIIGSMERPVLADDQVVAFSIK